MVTAGRHSKRDRRVRAGGRRGVASRGSLSADRRSGAQLALRVANVVQVALLFVVGFDWVCSIGGNGWRTGTVLMLSGVLLVGIAIAFGG